MTISVIIAHRNDKDRLRRTIDSIRASKSVNADVEIIVVDDASDEDPAVSVYEARTVRLREHHGVGAARNVGSGHADGDILVFTDSHMKFPPNWDIEMIATVTNNALFCSTYVSDVPFQSWWFDGFSIGGANLAHYVAKPGIFTLSQLTPRHAAIGMTQCYQVPAVIGACYYITSSFFRHIGGFFGLAGYGGDEQLLSWKTWLSGGRVLCNPKLVVTHLNSGPVVEHDYSKAFINLAYVLRVVVGETRFERFSRIMPFWTIPMMGMAQVRATTYFARKVEPDLISCQFGLQTIDEALALAENTCELNEPHGLSPFQP